MTPYGVTCNAINPGYVETELVRVGLERNNAGASIEETFTDAARSMSLVTRGVARTVVGFP
jgi:NAD(P)-dependent dehydrogenase (short-subunit alcohol dehydrogenase family)